MVQESISIKHPTIAFQFALANLAALQTATDVPIVGGVVNTYTMPLNGSIVGYAISKSAANDAGSLDFDLELNGTSTLTIAADTTGVYKTLNEGDEPFVAGDELGVTYTSDGSLNPLTVDVVVTVYVVLRNFDF